MSKVNLVGLVEQLGIYGATRNIPAKVGSEDGLEPFDNGHYFIVVLVFQTLEAFVEVPSALVWSGGTIEVSGWEPSACPV